MQPKILKTGANAGHFDGVFQAAAGAGYRIGWLELDAEVTAPSDLEAASSAGALRAVAVSSRSIVSVKRLKGPPVLRDVVREHFTGCRLVLVRGSVEAPEIVPDGERWLICWARGAERTLSTEQLMNELRKPGFP